MPIYEYYCQSCNRTHEILQGINDPILTECADCHGKLEKLISSTSFHLKGEGWYVTDYKDAKKKPDEKQTTTEDNKTSSENTTSTMDKTSSENKTTTTTSVDTDSKSN